MNEISRFPEIGNRARRPAPRSPKVWPWVAAMALVGSAGAYYRIPHAADPPHAPLAAAVPPVQVSRPLARDVDRQVGVLGQFSAVDRVELRAQVGGTLTEIHFRDGQIVHVGDLLFVVDSRPYEIKLAQAKAQLDSAQARFDLASAELQRAQTLRRSEFGTAETVDQRQGEQSAARAAIEDAKAQIRDAAFDVEHCRITAPFSGRIGAHLPSVGSLIAGGRYGASPTTLLTTLVSLDPIHLDFDLSEADFLAFSRKRAEVSGSGSGSGSEAVSISLGDEAEFNRRGALEFIDNALDRSSGTMHARALVPNPDLFLTPGEFARLKLTVSPPTPSLLLPDAAVMLDQSQHVVMTVSPDGVVTPKPVVTGDLRDGLRIIRSGLNADDRVIVDGLMRAQPGSKVEPHESAIGAASPTGTQG